MGGTRRGGLKRVRKAGSFMPAVPALPAIRILWFS